MKKIECIIKPKRLHTLKDYFVREGFGGMTISEVQGFGNQITRPENFLLLPKVKVEIYCPDERLDEIINLIMTVCNRNEMGDGKIAILNVDLMVRIRTGERNEKALV